MFYIHLWSIFWLSLLFQKGGESIWATVGFSGRTVRGVRGSDQRLHAVWSTVNSGTDTNACGAHERSDACLLRDAYNKTPVCAETNKITLFYRVIACSRFYWKQFIWSSTSFRPQSHIPKRNCHEERGAQKTAGSWFHAKMIKMIPRWFSDLVLYQWNVAWGLFNMPIEILCVDWRMILKWICGWMTICWMCCSAVKNLEQVKPGRPLEPYLSE
jgi:hypothetical protein